MLRCFSLAKSIFSVTLFPVSSHRINHYPIEAATSVPFMNQYKIESIDV